jgi:sulfatase maturation enzyme AslB (radical SAM superfamily)
METHCSAFWHHVNVRNDNRVFPCCRFKTPIGEFNGNLIEQLESPAFQKLREQSAQGTPISSCSKCYYEEQHGRTSLRQRLNADYDTETVLLEYVEVGFDNICNLTCDGCGDDFSSSWSKVNNPDAPKDFHIRSTQDIDSVPGTVNKISFHGGEPLMTNRHRRLLGMIPDRSQVNIVYNTNGTFLLDNETVDLLKECKTVRFLLSIDGYAELNEQVRGGSTWTDILKFIAQIKSMPFELRIHTTIHANNWQGLPRLEQFVREQEVVWTTNILTYPAHLDIKTVEDKSLLINTIEDTEIPNKTFILKHINT